MNGLTTPIPQARIGGHLEEAGPAHAVPKTDRLAVAVLLILATVVHGWLFAKTVIPARDGLSFSRLALQMESPSRIATEELPQPTVVDVLRKAEQPPGYPLAILAVSKIVRVVQPITAETDRQRTAQLGERMLLSGQIAGCVGGVLTVIPMFLLGRMLAGRFVGFAAAALFQMLPVASHITSDCLSEGCYLFALLMAAWLGARGMRRTGVGNFLGAGLMTGVSYLIRPEGGLVAVAIGGTLVVHVLTKRWTLTLGSSRLVAMAVGFGLVAGPYMMMIGGISNKPSEREFWQRMIFGHPREQLGNFDKTKAARPTMPLFAEWASDSVNTNRARFALTAVGMETLKSGHYAVVPFALVGLFAKRRRINVDGATMLFVMFIVSSLILLVAFASKIGYISERHTLPAVAVLCLFAAVGVEAMLVSLASWVPAISPRRDRWFVLIMLMACCVPSTFRTPHANRIGLKMAGDYLRDHAQPADIIVDPFSWSEFYSGASVTKLAPEPDSAKTLYVVMPGPADPSKHDRLPKMPLAKQIAASGSVVYHWPTETGVEKAKVLVYRTTR